MAIRNLDAIQRQGAMIAEQRENARRMREENFWNRVETIQKSHQDAIDAVDTIEALCENGLRGRFEDWMNSQKNVFYSFQFKSFYVICKVAQPQRESAKVSYYPSINGVQFAWNGWGMCESYNTATERMGHFIHNYLGKTSKGYDNGLTELAIKLQPFLDAFFKWVETI